MKTKNYTMKHIGCGGDVKINKKAKHFTEEYICKKCHKTTWDLGCRIIVGKCKDIGITFHRTALHEWKEFEYGDETIRDCD